MLARLRIKLNKTANATEVIALYIPSFPKDLEEAAWAVSDQWDLTSDFEDLVILHTSFENNALKVTFTVEATGEFLAKTLDRYLDGFADYLRPAMNSYYSVLGRHPDFDPTPIDWDVDLYTYYTGYSK
ncbi:MAG TPA: hypothetical protein PKD55_02575 [Bellilinea sp.]|nr:hypothetical protein [Bellilinea sp.]